MRILKYYILLFFISAPALAQDGSLVASLDSLKIRVGSQANLTLKTTVEEGTKVVFPQAKSFGQLEVLESYPVDTIEFEDKYQLVKKYGLTQFDSGRYAIPPLSVFINNAEHKTEPFYLEVADVKVDTTKQKMYDIKPVASQSSAINWWWYVFVLICFALIGFAFYKAAKMRRKKEKPGIVITPVEKATSAFRKLDHQQLLQKGEVKEFYSELSRIIRTYLEETIDIPAMESTTTGVMDAIKTAAPAKRITVESITWLDIERVLKNADMVKFAMSIPAKTEIETDRVLAENSINTIETAIPEPTQEEIELTEAYKLRQLHKQQRRKRTVIITACCSVVLGVLLFFGFQKLYSYLQENVIGYPTEDLWKGEWVKSEYGNPPITISTPKVLKRTDIKQQLPPEVLANFQEVQLFEFGAVFGSLNIGVATMKLMPGVDYDIGVAIEGTMKIWESRGAKHITVNTEVFALEDDKQGVRAYGNLSYAASPGKATRYYYEIIYFKQLQGMQYILIMREDQDEYGIKIAEKVKKSLEFRKAL